MKVVLMQDVPGLGNAGEIKEVDDEYARDDLLPGGYAALPPKDEIKQVLERYEQLAGLDSEQIREFKARLLVLPHLHPDWSELDVEVLQKIKQILIEAELLQKINQGLPAELGQRYSALIEKRDAEELTPDEHEELLDLTDQVEQLEAQRVAYLVELARLCNTSVTELIQELDIRPSMYV